MIIRLHVVKSSKYNNNVFLVSGNFWYFKFFAMYLSFSNKTRKIIALQKIRIVRYLSELEACIKVNDSELYCNKLV